VEHLPIISGHFDGGLSYPDELLVDTGNEKFN
jgi:hypothetical protein